MAEVAAAPAPAADAMQGIVSSATTETAAPEEPENISETLYIQNLNEKIKIDGNCLLHMSSFQYTEHLHEQYSKPPCEVYLNPTAKSWMLSRIAIFE
jgi:hypothetical protein